MPVARHVQYADFEAAWETVLRPWFARRARTAWAEALPSVVACPNGGLVSLLKQRLLEENLPALGIHFTTPGSLRRLLTSLLEAPPRLALREDLHLLARLVARQTPDEPVAQSVAADPSAFVRALDTLEAGGWGPTELPLPEAVGLGKGLQTLLEQCGLQTVRRVDWQLDAAAAKASPRLGGWLAVGFSSANWPEFALLRAACQSAEEATLCFRAEGEATVAAVWAGAWEALAGPIEDYLASAEKLPFETLVDAFAAHAESGAAQVRFTVTRGQAAEAEAILREVRSAQAREPTGRVGVVVPARPAGVGREIARVLAEAGLPHQDRLGHRPAKAPAHRLFTAWVAYQSVRNLSELLAFAQCLREVNDWPVTRLRALERAAKAAFGELMTQDLGPLAALSGPNGEPPNALADFMSDWPLLTEGADLQVLANQVELQLATLGWPEDLPALLERLSGLGKGLAGREIQGAAFLQWLSAVADIPGRTREPNAREPFAPVQLVTLPEAAGQSWDTLIFTGMTHEDWPRQSPESPFLPDLDVARLNARAIRTGAQGEGHRIVKNGCALMLNHGEEARQGAEDFIALVGSARGGLAATVSLGDPASPSLLRPVSEWYLRLFAADRGSWPEPRTLLAWANQTETVLHNSLEDNAIGFTEVTAAYVRRRDSALPFDAYSYGLEAPLPAGLALPASAWSRVFERPAQVWYGQVLRAESPFDSIHENPSRQARGSWAHAWVSLTEPGSQAWVPLPGAANWVTGVRAKAVATRERVRAAYEAAGRALPEWWLADWATALTLALGFAETVAESGLGPFAATEWRLESGVYPLNEVVKELTLRGRIDLLLADRPLDLGDEAAPLPSRLAIVDFKTGADKPLSDKRLLKGEGLQIALYALALRSLCGVETQAILLTPGVDCQPQLDTAAMDALGLLWRTVAEIASSGILGDLPEPSSGFGFAPPRPLAELTVVDEILRTRWALTHPGGEEADS